MAKYKITGLNDAINYIEDNRNSVASEEILEKLEERDSKQLVGISDDTKPTQNVPLYALFLELDTGEFYYFNGTSWDKVGGGA